MKIHKAIKRIYEALSGFDWLVSVAIGRNDTIIIYINNDDDFVLNKYRAGLYGWKVCTYNLNSGVLKHKDRDILINKDLEVIEKVEELNELTKIDRFHKAYEDAKKLKQSEILTKELALSAIYQLYGSKCQCPECGFAGTFDTQDSPKFNTKYSPKFIELTHKNTSDKLYTSEKRSVDFEDAIWFNTDKVCWECANCWAKYCKEEK